MFYERVHFKFSEPRLGLLRPRALSGDYSVAQQYETDKVHMVEMRCW